MPLPCRDCNHVTSTEQQLSGSCPRCGSIYLLPLPEQQNTRQPTIKSRNILSFDIKTRVLLYSILIAGGAWLLYQLGDCLSNDGDMCRAGARLVLGLLKLLAHAL